MNVEHGIITKIIYGWGYIPLALDSIPTAQISAVKVTHYSYIARNVTSY